MPTLQQPPGLDGIPLADFLDRLFVPQRLQNKSPREYSEAITWLERLLKRQVFLGDLRTSNLTRLQGFIAKQGFSQSRIRVIKTRLSTLGKHAWRLGMLPDWQPAPLKKIKQDPPAFLKSPAPAGTLAAAFRDIVRPQLEGKRDDRVLSGYSAAVGQFDRHLGRYAVPDDLSKDQLAAFQTSLLEAGRSEALFISYQTRLRKIARELDPIRFADRRKPRKQTPAPPGSLREFYETVYRPVKLVGASRQHVVDMKTTLKLFSEQHGEEFRPEDLTDEVAANFLTALLEKGLEPLTVNNHRARLFAVWRLAGERGRVLRDPRVKKLRENRDAPDAWSEEEARKILEAPLRLKWKRDIEGIPAGKLWRALLLVAYWTGLRRRSLFQLRRKDIDLASGWINISGSQIKNRYGKRLRLGPDAITALREIWTPERELVFPFAPHSKIISRHFRRIMHASGVAPSTRKSMTQFHKMRRTVATLTAVSRGLGAACDLLGHSSDEVTRRYIDPSKLPGQDATEFLPILTEAADPFGERCEPKPTPRSPAEFLTEAKQLFSLGYTVAAAMEARAALERALSWAAVSCGFKPNKTTGVAVLCQRLVSAELLDQEQQQRISRISKTANRAAHGNDVQPQKVAELLLVLEELFSSVLAERIEQDQSR